MCRWWALPSPATPCSWSWRLVEFISPTILSTVEHPPKKKLTFAFLFFFFFFCACSVHAQWRPSPASAGWCERSPNVHALTSSVWSPFVSQACTQKDVILSMDEKMSFTIQICSGMCYLASQVGALRLALRHLTPAPLASVWSILIWPRETASSVRATR